jgi:small-conductance mechanosensitive channel
VAEILIESASPGLTILIIAGGISVAARIWPMDPRWIAAVNVLVAAAVALALIVFLDRASRRTLTRSAANSPALQGAYGLIEGSIRGVIIAIGVLIFLDSIGISITPILASLGVGSLAVALALQDTLANLFAGFYVIADKPIQIGDLVRLESGQEGYLARLGWRSSKFRTEAGGMVVVPNSKLVSSVIINYSLADAQVAFSVDLKVRADIDADRLEQITMEVARDVMRTVAGAVKDYEPSVRFSTLGAEMGVTVSLRSQPHQNYVVRHEFIKRLEERYLRENVKLV